jgi:cytochrome b involved in lipid metabolism
MVRQRKKSTDGPSSTKEEKPTQARKKKTDLERLVDKDLREGYEKVLDYLLLIVVLLFTSYMMSLYMKYFTSLYKKATRSNEHFTEESLSQYVNDDKLYLSILGKVYDVTSGKKHYGKGQGYHYFVGKDATKSFVSGQFEGEVDHDLSDLPLKDILGIEDWAHFYDTHENYTYKGYLEGVYYKEDGKYNKAFYDYKKLLKKAKIEKVQREETKKLYPSCNTHWTQQTGGTIWCGDGKQQKTDDRVPRMIKLPGIKEPRCGCVPIKKAEIRKDMEILPECDKYSHKCKMIENNK